MKTITCESVNIGHPDKTCDYIADCFLDEALRQDPNAQMAIECAIKDDLLMIYGEATTIAKIDYIRIASDALSAIGYDKPFRILQQISQQSADINQALNKNDTLKAGDQGMMYGYATSEIKEMLPLPLVLAHKLMQRYDSWRKGRRDFFADAKAQVSVKYVDDEPRFIGTLLVSVSHSDSISHDEITRLIESDVVGYIKADPEYSELFDTNITKIIINPSGKFTIWGSYGDSGCVGRKICVDTYGGVGKVGGGCFSSKSPQKVDRSAAYYARYVAKNVVAAGLATRCEIGVSYGIGIAEPISLSVDTFGTGDISTIKKFIKANFNFTPANIIVELDLKKPIYKDTACYGHFGRDEFSWERIKEIPPAIAAASDNTPKSKSRKVVKSCGSELST